MNDTSPAGHAYVCRCEELDEAAIRAAIAAGARTVNDLKRRTRAGMGLCQGAYCLEHLARIMRAAGADPRELTPMTSRPPARLITLAELGTTASRDS